MNRATENGCPAPSHFGDPGDREPEPDPSRISDGRGRVGPFTSIINLHNLASWPCAQQGKAKQRSVGRRRGWALEGRFYCFKMLAVLGSTAGVRRKGRLCSFLS